MLDYIMTRTNVMPRLNSRVLSPTDKYLEFGHHRCKFVVHWLFLYLLCRLQPKTVLIYNFVHLYAVRTKSCSAY